jgi:hypothetical protein
MKTNDNYAALKTRDTNVLRGIDKCVTGTTTLGGNSYTTVGLKAVFQAHIDAIDQVERQHAALHDAVAAVKAARKAADDLYLLLRTGIVVSHGKNAQAALSYFGMIAPRKPGRPTAEGKAVAAAKRAATRAARGASTVSS